MNTPSTRRSVRRWLVAIGAVGALFAGTAARASDVHWSIGLSAPIHHGAVSTVISSGPGWGYAAAAPVYVAPAPVYVAPAPVYVAPPPRYYYRAAAPVVVHRGGHGHFHRGHDHRRGDWRGHDGHRYSHDHGGRR